MSDIFQSVYQHLQFSAENIKVIAKAHQRIEIMKGSFLLKEGKTANEYYLLEKGLVRALHCSLFLFSIVKINLIQKSST